MSGEGVESEGHVTTGYWDPGFLAERLGWAGYEVSHIALVADGRYSITMVQADA